MHYDDLYKALADEHRREIVSALCAQPIVAGDLARRVGLAPNALSFHLKWLRSAGLIDMQRRGRHLWYHLNDATLDAWRSHVNTAFRPQPALAKHIPPRAYPVPQDRITREPQPASLSNSDEVDELTLRSELL